MGGVGCKGDGGARAHQLSFALDDHWGRGNSNLGNGSITSSGEEVAIRKKGHAVNTLREKFAGSNSHEETTLEVNLNDIAS